MQGAAALATIDGSGSPMRTFEIVVSGLVLALCVLLLLRLALPASRRARVDAAWRSAGRALQAFWGRAVTAPGRRRAAAREANDLIERARRARPDEGEGEWEGNVYRPKSFKRPKKPH